MMINWNWFLNLVIDNIVWIVLVAVFIKFLPGIFKAFIISKIILKKNRTTKGGGGLGKYLADRFIDIWYSKPQNYPHYLIGVWYKNTVPQNSGSMLTTNLLDEELINMGLIQKINSGGYEVLKPIKSWRNRLITTITKFYLIHFTGDNPEYYKNFKK